MAEYTEAEIREHLQEAIWEHERSPETSIWSSFWDRINEGGLRAPLPELEGPGDQDGR